MVGRLHTPVTHSVTMVSKHLTEQFGQLQEAKDRQRVETEQGRPFQEDLAPIQCPDLFPGVLRRVAAGR